MLAGASSCLVIWPLLLAPSNFGKVGNASLADVDPLEVNQNMTNDEVGGLDNRKCHYDHILGAETESFGMYSRHQYSQLCSCCCTLKSSKNLILYLSVAFCSISHLVRKRLYLQEPPAVEAMEKNLYAIIFPPIVKQSVHHAVFD